MQENKYVFKCLAKAAIASDATQGAMSSRRLH